MKRKLVQQGNNGFTISLPKKWIVENNLKKGYEVSVISHNENLIINHFNPNSKIKHLIINTDDNTAIRIAISNAYRMGYDKIYCKHTDNNKLKIKELSDLLLLGFENFEEDKNTIILENMFLNDIEKLDNILYKYFLLLDNIFKKVLEEDISQYIKEIDKYTNFFKRAINNLILFPKQKFFFWTLITELNHAAKICLKIQNIEKESENKKYCVEMKKNIYLIYSIIKNGFFDKKGNELETIRKIQQKYFEDIDIEFFQKYNPIITSHFMTIIRMLYMASSPLSSIIKKEKSE